MKALRVLMHGIPAGRLCQGEAGVYHFEYDDGYAGPAVSRTLPVRARAYEFTGFPSFFDGLLPEGIQLEHLLRQRKIDAGDKMGQLLAVGEDLVGAVSVVEAGS